MSNWVRQAELAKMMGVSRQSINNKVRTHQIPSNKEGLIDLESQEVIDYINGHNLAAIKRPGSLTGGAKSKKGKSKHEKMNDIATHPERIVSVDKMIEDFDLDLTKKIVDIRNKETDTRKKQMQLELQRGTLVERGLVAGRVFGYIDEMNRRMLMAPVKYIDQVIALVEAEGQKARQKIIDLINEETSLAIKSTKRGVTDELKKAAKMHENDVPDDDDDE